MTADRGARQLPGVDRGQQQRVEMDEIWNGDRAVLSAVVELYETTGAYVEPQQVLDAFPVEQHGDVLHSLRRCGDHGFIEAVTAPAMGQNGAWQIVTIKSVTESAYEHPVRGRMTPNYWSTGSWKCSPSVPNTNESRRSSPSTRPGRK
ncbi:MAG: hypothetical protein M3257_07970 [Actinomycetota bacterium]|nr:hypothetical protein [Actinomycetota bacterium]